MCNTTCKPLAFDTWSGRYFNATIQDVQEAINDVNSLILDEGDVDLNTYYDRIGLAPIPMGVNYGWSGEQLRMVIGSIVSPDGLPALTFSFRRDPRPDLGAVR